MRSSNQFSRYTIFVGKSHESGREEIAVYEGVKRDASSVSKKIAGPCAFDIPDALKKSFATLRKMRHVSEAQGEELRSPTPKSFPVANSIANAMQHSESCSFEELVKILNSVQIGNALFAALPEPIRTSLSKEFRKAKQPGQIFVVQENDDWSSNLIPWELLRLLRDQKVAGWTGLKPRNPPYLEVPLFPKDWEVIRLVKDKGLRKDLVTSTRRKPIFGLGLGNTEGMKREIWESIGVKFDQSQPIAPFSSNDLSSYVDGIDIFQWIGHSVEKDDQPALELKLENDSKVPFGPTNLVEALKDKNVRIVSLLSCDLSPQFGAALAASGIPITITMGARADYKVFSSWSHCLLSDVFGMPPHHKGAKLQDTKNRNKRIELADQHKWIPVFWVSDPDIDLYPSRHELLQSEYLQQIKETLKFSSIGGESATPISARIVLYEDPILPPNGETSAKRPGHQALFGDIKAGLHVLFGEGGSGKTTSSRELLRGEHLQDRVPVFVDLPKVTSEALDNWIYVRNEIEKHIWPEDGSWNPHESKVALQSLIRKPRLVVFDGLDELSVDQQSKFAAGLIYADTSRKEDCIVITTRHLPGTMQLLHQREFKTWAIQPLTQDDVEVYVRSRLKNRGASQLITMIKENTELQHSVSNPLFLDLVTTTFNANGANIGATNLSILFENATEEFLKNSNSNSPTQDVMRYSRESRRYLLERIAWELVAGDSEDSTIISFERIETLVKQIFGTRETNWTMGLVDNLVKRRMLCKSTESDYEFLHNHFRDFFAARFFMELWIDKKKTDPIHQLSAAEIVNQAVWLVEDRWTQMLAFCGGLIENRSINLAGKFLIAVMGGTESPREDDFYGRRLLVAARCFERVKSQELDGMRSRIGDLLYEHWGAEEGKVAEFFASLPYNDHERLSPLLDLAARHSANFRRAVISVLNRKNRLDDKLTSRQGSELGWGHWEAQNAIRTLSAVSDIEEVWRSMIAVMTEAPETYNSSLIAMTIAKSLSHQDIIEALTWYVLKTCVYTNVWTYPSDSDRNEILTALFDSSSKTPEKQLIVRLLLGRDNRIRDLGHRALVTGIAKPEVKKRLEETVKFKGLAANELCAISIDEVLNTPWILRLALDLVLAPDEFLEFDSTKSDFANNTTTELDELEEVSLDDFVPDCHAQSHYPPDRTNETRLKIEKERQGFLLAVASGLIGGLKFLGIGLWADLGKTLKKSLERNSRRIIATTTPVRIHAPPIERQLIKKGSFEDRDHLLSQLQHADIEIKMNAAVRLREFRKSPHVQKVLLQAMEDNCEKFRHQVISSLFGLDKSTQSENRFLLHLSQLCRTVLDKIREIPEESQVEANKEHSRADSKGAKRPSSSSRPQQSRPCDESEISEHCELLRSAVVEDNSNFTGSASEISALIHAIAPWAQTKTNVRAALLFALEKGKYATQEMAALNLKTVGEHDSVWRMLLRILRTKTNFYPVQKAAIASLSRATAKQEVYTTLCRALFERALKDSARDALVETLHERLDLPDYVSTVARCFRESNIGPLDANKVIFTRSEKDGTFMKRKSNLC